MRILINRPKVILTRKSIIGGLKFGQLNMNQHLVYEFHTVLVLNFYKYERLLIRAEINVH